MTKIHNNQIKHILSVFLAMTSIYLQPYQRPLIVSLSKKLYPYCLVLVGSRSELKQDFTIKLKLIEGLMED